MPHPAAFALILSIFVQPPAASPPSGAEPAGKVLIPEVPHVRQKPDFCGEACAEMYLRKLGHALCQDDVFNASGLDPRQGRGCFTAELDAALRKLGFKTGKVWESIASERSMRELEARWEEIVKDLGAGIPSIVCMRYDEPPRDSEHFRLVLGYDPRDGNVIYHEPAEEGGAYRSMTREKFFRLWPIRGGGGKWSLIRLRLDAGKFASPEPAAGFTPADYAQSILELKKKLPGSDFHILIQPPFVVAGDEPEDVLRKRADGTIRWAAEKLKREFFSRDPAKILEVWLFRDRQSYQKHTQSIFKDRPTTPFGYYSSEHGALIMNIGTGGGTLVHEMVHPFMETNFPTCPAWFNEGLASLYEQSCERDDRIHGDTNWRLEGLQKAIRGKELPSFEALMSTTTQEFYSEQRGLHYAQARYLCYYLQEQNLLRDFYSRFAADSRKDPTGYGTLKRTLGEPDMKKFQASWEKFVLELRFP